ncbi:MAG: DUF1559 domain-containing protein [Pirellulales bacterium]
MNRGTSLIWFVLFLLLLGRSGPTLADEIPTGLLARYINNDTLVVATAKIDPAFVAQLQALVGPKMVTPVDRAMMEKLTPILESWGDRRVFLIGGLGDFPGTGPLLIATAGAGENAAQLAEFANNLREVLPTNPKATFSGDVRVVNDSTLLIGSQAALARYEAQQPQPRPELIDTLTELVNRNAAVAAVVAPGPDARRVLREMWPPLPPPFDAVTGPLLAERVKQITFAATLPPRWDAEVAIHTTDDEAAETLAKTGQQIVQQFGPMIQGVPPLEDADWPAMLQTITPKQDGAAVKLTVAHHDAEMAGAIAKLVAAAVGEARQDAQRNQRMNQFKQLAIAFQNFHDTQKHFSASAAICDKDGKPLLSWRVAMLPFIDETELFNEFHLDEPWDSEHNLKLIERMPDLYADPERPNHDGKTTYQLPVHNETVFPTANVAAVTEREISGRKLFFRQGLTFRDITDGTSQTIMVVEAAPDRAVPWTKPTDWEVDLANPLDGLKQEGRDGFVSAFCDGSARYISFAVSPETLRKLLARADGEVIDESY